VIPLIGGAVPGIRRTVPCVGFILTLGQLQLRLAGQAHALHEGAVPRTVLSLAAHASPAAFPERETGPGTAAG
jgi:hypothetical protein